MKILNFGSLNIDYVYTVEHFVRPGETLSSLKMEVFCGGKGLNQSIALARAGAEVYHAGGIGKADGAALKDALARNGVRTQYVRELDVPSGHAVIQVDHRGQNCILLYGGANAGQTPEYIRQVVGSFSPGDYIVLQNEVNGLDELLCRAHEQGMKIVLNPSPMNEKILDAHLEYVDYLVVNEVEAGDLCPGTEKKALLEALSVKYPKAAIVLTLGKEGAWYKDTRLTLHHGIYDMPVADTTAAGDTFTGFFIALTAGGFPPEEALHMASAASSIAVSRKGAAPSIPYINEVHDELPKMKLLK